jgi:hypothetical protein
VRRMSSGAGRWLVLALVGATLAAGCGRYGPPLRAEQYRAGEKERQDRETERRKGSPEERNEPMPASP